MSNIKQKTILLVEDEAIIAMTESMALRKYGYNIIHVLNGQKAIATVCNNEIVIDLILMDINLGNEEMDGTEIAKIILKDKDIPILFLSSHIEREIVNKTENITSYGYVVKDSSITVLDASIKMAFRLHEAYLDLKGQKKSLEGKRKELQVYEKRYRRLFEAAKDGILILNADNGMIVDVNPFLITLLKYSKEEFLDKKIWEISAFKNIDYAKQLYKELKEKDYVRYDDLPLESSDGVQVHVEIVSNVYLVDNARVIQCNIRDISERREHDKILKDNIEQKEVLLKEIQHRIKNSFNLITSLINLRAGVTDSEEAKNVLQELTLRVKSISDLYTLLYETDSFYEVRLQSYFDKVISSTLNFSKNITVTKNIEDMNCSTNYAALIGMILVELLSNAIKYAYPGSKVGIIDIQFKIIENQVLFVIEDNGIGLPEDFDINKISSLGLHLVNLMVNQLNGNIKFIPGNGTKIIINLPLEKGNTCEKTDTAAERKQQ